LKNNLVFLGRQLISGVKQAEQVNQLRVSAAVAGRRATFSDHHSSPQEKAIEKPAGLGVCNGQSEKIIKEGRLSKTIFSNQYSC